MLYCSRVKKRCKERLDRRDRGTESGPLRVCSFFSLFHFASPRRLSFSVCSCKCLLAVTKTEEDLQSERRRKTRATSHKSRKPARTILAATPEKKKTASLKGKPLFLSGSKALWLRTRGYGVREATVPITGMHEIGFSALRVKSCSLDFSARTPGW